MDKNLEQIYRHKIDITIKKLLANNFAADFFETEEELLAFLKKNIKKGSSIGVGGSQTLFETGVIKWLTKNKNYEFYDRYTNKDKALMQKKTLTADVFLTSSNAVTMDGMLYNVDGHGSRVAPLIFGPDKVYVIVGANKIVKDVPAAIMRNEQIAAPANNVRLQKGNPCEQIGECVHCNKESTICNQFVLTRRSGIKGRIHVLFLLGEYGY